MNPIDRHPAAGWSPARAAAVCAVALALALPAPIHLRAQESPIVGIVDGEPIRADQLQNREIAKLREKLYELELDGFRARSLALLRQRRPESFPEPRVSITDAEVERLYVESNLSRQGTLEALADNIRSYLEARKRGEIDRLQYRMAEAQGLIENHLVPPVAFLIELPLVKRAASKGAPNAIVRIVEFSDFQCPFCNRSRPVVRQVMERFRGRVHLTYRHLPLVRIHPRAQELAEASECAAEQGRFWPFHDLVFDRAAELDRTGIMTFARDAKVPDLERFGACVANHRYAQRVEEDLRAAESLGIGGTPTFFVGKVAGKDLLKGIVLEGAQPFPAFEKAIERMIASEIK